MTGKKTYKGKYKVKNPKKYYGDVTNVYYRSSWERAFCRWCDTSKKVILWGIEPIHILYFDVTTKKYRRYFPDFVVKFADATYIIEIKPNKEKFPPKKGKRKSKKYLLAEQTFLINQAKWKAAKKFCEQKGWEFKVFDEYDLKNLGLKVY